MKMKLAKGWIAPISVAVVACVGFGVMATVSRNHSPQDTAIHYAKPLPAAVAKQTATLDPGTSLGGVTAPGFTLKNQFGKTVSLSQFRGKVVVLAFVDSECTTICPLTTADMVNAVNALGVGAKNKIQLVGIDANPDAISVHDVMNYSKVHNMVNNWDFLTGNLSQLHAVWKSYHIDSQIVKGQIDHTPALYVIDPNGKEQWLYMTPSTYSSVAPETMILAKDIADVLPSGSTSASDAVHANKNPLAAKETNTALPAVVDGRVQGTISVAPTKPTLLAFFGSWVPGIDSDLQALAAYRKQTNAPNVLGIDVMTTEPSEAWVLQKLKPYSTGQLPIGLDVTGHIADDMHVTDLMWLTLLDGKGHVLWSHDGFLPVSQLQKIVSQKLSHVN